MKSNITILYKPKKITLMYSLYPFWVSKYVSLFTFTSNENWVLEKDKNRFLLLVGWFDGQDKNGDHKLFLEKLNKKYDKVSFFDDNDGSESHYLDLLPYIERYYKKQIFKEKTNYSRHLYGNRIFADYYHRTFGIEELHPKDPLPKLENLKDLDKMKVSWNLAMGQYPLSKPRNFIAKKGIKVFGKKIMPHIFSKSNLITKCPTPIINHCQARFGYKGYRESVGFQRKLFSETLQNKPRFLTGLISPKAYNHELKNVKAVFSPFGWGEICFRDFEAILSGAVLIKPDVSHIETWPNIYISNETYVPVKWDGSDVIEKTEVLFQNPSEMEFIKNNAWNNLQKSYSTLDDRVLSIINDFEVIKK